jgi:hypothetical protein
MKPTQIILAAAVIGLTACSGEPSMTDFIGTYEKSQKGNDQSTLEIFKHEGTLMIKGALAETNSYAMKRIFIAKKGELPPFEAALRPITEDEIVNINRFDTIPLKTSNTWVSTEHGLMVTRFKDKPSQTRFGSEYVLRRDAKTIPLIKLH